MPFLSLLVRRNYRTNVSVKRERQDRLGDGLDFIQNVCQCDAVPRRDCL